MAGPSLSPKIIIPIRTLNRSTHCHRTCSSAARRVQGRRLCTATDGARFSTTWQKGYWRNLENTIQKRVRTLGATTQAAFYC